MKLFQKHKNWVLVLIVCGLVSSSGFAGSYDKFRMGPSIQLAVPHPLNLGLDARFHRMFSVGVNGGYLPVNLTIGGTATQISLTNYEARARWHPFSGAFFLGGAFGQQRVSARASKSIALAVQAGDQTVSLPLNLDVSLNLQSWYATPHLGWMWIFDSGFCLGFELGVQWGFGSRSSFDISIQDPTLNSYLTQVKEDQEYKDLRNSIEGAGNKIGNAVLPFVTALRIGWLF